MGKDITRKLYMLNENVYNATHSSKHASPGGGPGSGGHHHGVGGGRRGTMMKMLDFQRTNSSDAINTGCRGFVRSNDWIANSGFKDASDGEAGFPKPKEWPCTVSRIELLFFEF